MMIGGLLRFVIACSGLGLSFGREVSDCYANNLNPYLLFGKKTSYVFAHERYHYGDNHLVENCEPIQIWMLTRHGTRYPGRETIRMMHSLHDLKIQIMHNHDERKNGRLCQPDLENLRSWTVNVTMADSILLTHQGKEELRLLGRRIRNKYPSLFQNGYSQNMFEFRHTDHDRTRQSAQAFADGLFGENASVWIPPGIPDDEVTHPYENCTHWLRNVEYNPRTMRERNLFLQGMEMRALVHNVSQRLGFLYDLPKETVINIYNMCRLNKAWAVGVRSPWCAAFTREELKVMEYAEDLETYYSTGYGSDLNIRLGCTPLKDMLQRFEQLEDDTIERGYQPAGVFYFSRSKIIIMMLTRMGLFSRGPPPRHYNYNSQDRREWRISKISPFAANFAAVFFKCSSGEYNRVMFFLNEKRIDFDNCELGLCSWSYIRNRFHDVLHHCNLDWCRNAGSSTTISSILIFSIYGLIHNFII